MTSRRSQLQEDTYFRVLRMLQDNPDLTQRDIAERLGVSTSGLNYCLNALIDKGWVKVQNFSQSKNKFGYIYMLTPQGIVEKVTLTSRFLKRKQAEYEALRTEIDGLTDELGFEKKNMNTEHKTIAIIGLGYVGLPLAVEFGKLRPTIGFDINQARINELQSGKDHTLECSPEDLKAAGHLRYSANLQDLQQAQVFIVTVPTPVDQANRPDMTPLVKASETVGKVLKVGDTVIYESTVYPGATEEVCVPVLEKFSGLKFNQDFFGGYSPERINPGDKVNTLTTIRKITSGSTPEVAEAVDQLYGQIIKAGTWKASSIKVAEAAKVIENSQRDLNIAFVNELSVIFDRIGIDTLEVLEAAGSKWNFLPFRPGMVGGHCIGVDPYYLTHKAEELGYHPQVILAGRRINDDMARYAAQGIIKRMLQNGIDVSRSTVGVMGITFKENCPDIRNSKVVDLVKELQGWGAKVVVTDPWANPAEVEHEYSISLGQIGPDHKVDSLIVAVGHQEFRAHTAEQLRSHCNGGNQPVIGDLKSLFSRRALADVGFTVFRL